MITRDDVVWHARDWVDTPWKHQAALKDVGTDCVGLLVGVAYELGITDARAHVRAPVYNGYGRSPNPELLLQGCDEYLDEIPIAQAGLGDILLMMVPKGVDPQHFAIISALDPPYIIHAYAQARKVVENRLDEKWSARVVRAYRYRGVE